MPDGNWPFLMVGGVPVVTAPAEVDITTAGQLRAMLAGAAARGHTTVVVDLAGTQFCDCAGLHALVRAHKQAQAKGGGLRLLLPVRGPVPRIFTLTGLDRVIPHFTSLEQVLAHAPVGRSRPPRPRSSRGCAAAPSAMPALQAARPQQRPDRQARHRRAMVRLFAGPGPGLGGRRARSKHVEEGKQDKSQDCGHSE